METDIKLFIKYDSEKEIGKEYQIGILETAKSVNFLGKMHDFVQKSFTLR